jgi:hypothetical protein
VPSRCAGACRAATAAQGAGIGELQQPEGMQWPARMEGELDLLQEWARAALIDALGASQEVGGVPEAAA